MVIHDDVGNEDNCSKQGERNKEFGSKLISINNIGLKVSIAPRGTPRGL